jgi:3-phosphoshikimate 1-carboxyvinyltransferase
MMHTYPAEIEIATLKKTPCAIVTVPGSKSITNRAFVLAALTARDKPCRLTGVLRSEDTEVMVGALTKLGYAVEPHWDTSSHEVIVGPHPTREGVYPPFPADLFVANSGTTMRFLAALVTLGCGRFRLDGIPRMRERPAEDLLDALRQVGVNAYSELSTGCPPLIIKGHRYWEGHRLKVRGDTSSQFLTALLMVAPFAVRDSRTFWIELDGPLVSEPYVAMTMAMMKHWGLVVERSGNLFEICKVNLQDGSQLQHQYAIEPDASAASYFWAAAAITGGQITVAGLSRNSLQGDVRFVDVLEQMGCCVVESDLGITVHGRPLRGVDVDMNAISDTVMTLAAVACFADGPTTIRNVAHIRHKETDRIAAVATELRKLGARVEERVDGLTIIPRPLTGCAVDTYNDHRMAMSFALIGLKLPGVLIRNPSCVAKTYPVFWDDLNLIRM